MKIKVNSTALKNAVKDVQKALDKRPLIPLFKCIVIDAEGDDMLLKAADNDLSVIRKVKDAKIEEKGLAAVVYENGLSAALNLPDGEITITADGKQLTITYPNGTFFLPTEGIEDMDVFGMKNMEEQERIMLPTTLLRVAIGQSLPALSAEALHPIVCNLCLDLSETSLTLAATDGKKLICNRIKGNFGKPRQILLPSKAASLLTTLSKETETIQMQADYHRMAITDCNTFTLYISLPEGHYPNYNSVISPIRGNTHLKADADRKQLTDALGRLSAFTNQSNLFRLTFTYNQIDVKAEDKDFNKLSEETIACSTMGDAERIEMGINGKYLREMLGVLDTDNVSILLQDASRAMLIEPIVPEYAGEMETEVVVMPMHF